MKEIIIAIEELEELKSPYKMLTYTDKVLISCLCQGLVTYENQKIIPALCDNYQILDNGFKYKFKFGNKKWSNGENITAYDFLNMFYFLISNYKEYSCTEQLMVIKGTSDYIEGKHEINQISIYANDANNLEIMLVFGNYDFINVLASCTYSPVYYNLSDSNIFSITNGAYYLESSNIEIGELVVKRNPYFHIQSNIEKIIFKVVHNADKQKRMYDNNQLDITCNTLYSKQYEKDIIIKKIPLKYFLYINSKIGLNSLDRQQIQKKINNINWNKLSVIFSNDCSFICEDVCKNKTEEKKFYNQKTEYKLLYADYYPNKIVAEKIKELMNEIGYNVFLKQTDYRLFPQYINEMNYDFILAITTPAYIAPSSMLNMFVDCMELEDRKKEYLLLMCDYFDAYSKNLSKNNILNKLENILQQKLPIIPICGLNAIYKKRNKITGFNYKIDGTPTYERINIEENKK